MKYFDKYDWDFECAILRTGSSFGEQAFISDGNRLVTIRANSDCYLASVDKFDFKKVLKKIEAREIQA